MKPLDGASGAPSEGRRRGGVAAFVSMGPTTAVTLLAFVVIAGVALWFVIRPMFLAA